VGKDSTVYVVQDQAYHADLQGLVLQAAIFALDGTSGALRWTVKMDAGEETASPPALSADGILYVVGDVNLYAIDTATGTQKWRVSLGTHTTAFNNRVAPAIGDDGTIYVKSDVRFSAFDPSTGTQKWSIATGNPSALYGNGAFAVGADGTLYAGATTNQDIVEAVDGASGVVKWSTFVSRGYGITASPAIGHDGTVYVAKNTGELISLSPVNGTVLHTFATEKTGNRSSPTVGLDGTVYFGSSDTFLYAVDGTTLLERWHFKAGGIVSGSPAIGKDGTLYFGADDGIVYAVQ